MLKARQKAHRTRRLCQPEHINCAPHARTRRRQARPSLTAIDASHLPCCAQWMCQPTHMYLLPARLLTCHPRTLTCNACPHTHMQCLSAHSHAMAASAPHLTLVVNGPMSSAPALRRSLQSWGVRSPWCQRGRGEGKGGCWPGAEVVCACVRSC